MGGEFDFSKGQIPINSPSKPRRGEVGDNIDRCIIPTQCGCNFVLALKTGSKKSSEHDHSWHEVVQ